MFAWRTQLVIISNEILYENFPGYYPIELAIYLDLKSNGPA